MRRLMIWLGVLVGGYLAICLLVFLLQERLLFVAAGRGAGNPLDVPVGAEVLELPLGEKGSFRVARSRPIGDPRAVMIFFVGNGEDLRSGLRWGQEFAAYGLISVVVEFPGYGGSAGRPGKTDFFAAADRALELAALEAKSAQVPLIAGGSSLGTALAVYLASKGTVERLLLRAPPASIKAAARFHYPWLPTDWLLREELCFDSLSLAALVRCPSLVIHGDQDHVVPQAMGRELAAALAGESEFISAVGYGHNDLSLSRQSEFGPRIAAFLLGK